MTDGSASRTPDRSGLRILLVDDDPAIARLIQQLLKLHGFPQATYVETGQAALAAADQADLVLLDHQLPDASGLDILEVLRSRPSPPAIVLVTAHGNESLAAKALRNGADDYLAKDASLPELLPQVLERVRRNRALREALTAAERELMRAERLAAVGEMTVTLHHEINNPLMSASAEVELLLGEPSGQSASVRESLEAVKHSLNRIRDIVRRVGELRRADSTAYPGDLRMIDISGPRSVRAVQRGAAVLYVPEEDVVRVSSLLLRAAGFEVRTCATVAELTKAADAMDVQLVIVGGAGAAPLAGFRPAPDRIYRLVALVAGDQGVAASAGADHVILLPFDPETLTGELLGVLEGTQ
jgi:DNA-binding response OmpR family regulator